MKKVRIPVREIIDFLGSDILTVLGSVGDAFIDNVADAAHTTETTLDWINPAKANKQEIAEKNRAKVMLVDPTIEYSSKLQNTDKVLIVVERPKITLSKIITEFFLEKKISFIHPTVVIDNKAMIDATAFIDAGCVIGKATIGRNSVLRANVCIYDDVVIGDNCIIQAGSVIGTDGLGCSRETDGTLIKFPHLGGVIIGNNVEIGANCQIARGALSNTIISDGCKLNGMCFIAHNCVLEKNVWITGSTMLSGSTHVGANATIFSNVVVREQTYIGEGAIIGMGSVVTKDIPAGETWLGNPARKQEKQ
jgi:UDP-3-O-[3-hydroxymyristoyl] glucosamine N-acyltransferase